MSKINGDKARHAKRARKQTKMRERTRELRATFAGPLKTSLTPETAPRPEKSAKSEKKSAKPVTAAK